jgi:penicillin-binding protein 1A
MSTALLLLAFIGATVYTWSVFNSLGSRVEDLTEKTAQLRKEPTEIYSADGFVLARLADERREPVAYADIPKLVVDATVAAEDKRFWDHSGVDVTAIVRAIWVNLSSGSVRQGGSTITQQVAKRLLTSGDRTFRRKVEDACLALQIERAYTKEQIIELYLNEVYYGSQAYGIKAAAEVYFGKDLDELSTSEAALLARLPRRPSDENPYVDMQAAKDNRNVVLQIMEEEGLISQSEFNKSVKQAVKLVGVTPNQTLGIKRANYYTNWILSELREIMPDEDFRHGGYKIYTTLNYNLQKKSEETLHDTIRRYRGRRVTEGALVVMDLNGEVVTMVGGNDFSRSQMNVITQGHRQPGSAFKPFVYATALDMGVLSPRDSVSNAPYIERDSRGRIVWQPKGGGRGGRVSIKSAIVNSINVPAVHVGVETGLENVSRFAHDVFGFRSEIPVVPSVSLGTAEVTPLEMAEAYTVFATRGNRVKPFGIRKIVDPDGQVRLENQPKYVPDVLSRNTAEFLHECLRGVVTSGTGRAASGVADAAGKTGTTNSYKDAWFCGYTDKLVAIAWVANASYDPDRNPPWVYGTMGGIMGGQVSAGMWAHAVRPVQAHLEKYNKRILTMNSDVHGEALVSELSVVRVCAESGERAVRGCPDTEMRDITREDARELGRCSLHGEPPVVPDPDPEGDVTEETEEGPEEEPPTVADSRRPDPTPASAPPRPPDRPRVETTRVEICVETMLRATQYCRLKRGVTFRRGEEPGDYCQVHRP